MRRATSLAAIGLFIAATAGAQDDTAPSKDPLGDAKKRATEELQKIGAAMAKKGYKGEAGDADAIVRKLAAFDKPIRASGGSTPYPGDAEFAEICTAWGELGTQLCNLFSDAEKSLEKLEKEEADKAANGATKVAKAKAELMRQQWARQREEAEILSGWFSTFAGVGAGTRHLNRRRKFCKMPPVTCTWAGSFGGFMHGRYLRINKDHPSTAGLGAHNEERNLPGWSVEGSEAGGGILGGGGPEGCMDMWLGSAYHRDPVFNRSLGRIAFGGSGWWSCRSAGGAAGRTDATVFTFPGDGDTDITCSFGGEAPDPLPKGMQSAGTMIVIEYNGPAPMKPLYKLLDEDGKEVEILMLQKWSPVYFVAKNYLKPGTKYTVEVVGQQNGFKHSFSFTTVGGRPRQDKITE
jgi:hypothetical protein